MQLTKHLSSNHINQTLYSENFLAKSLNKMKPWNTKVTQEVNVSVILFSYFS